MDYLVVLFHNRILAVYQLAEVILLLLSLLWLLRQIILTDRRVRAEEDLKEYGLKNQFDLRLYSALEQRNLEMRKLHHDFANKLQVMQVLLMQEEEEARLKAASIASEMMLQ